MTNPSPKQGLLSRSYDRAAIHEAASREAARAGRHEVGFEHLLLGILVNGGPGARLLMNAGVGLSEGRSAIDGILREDLALLGIDVPVPPPSGGGKPGLLPLTPRLEEIEIDCPWSGGDTALLAALIDDEGGRVRRLLDRLGVDTDRFRRDLDEPVEAPEPIPADGSRLDGQPSEGWACTTYDLQVPVSAERVWELVSAPGRRSEWEPSAVSSRQLGGGVVELTAMSGQTSRESMTHSVPGREVTWTRNPGSETPRRTRIVIEPVGDHARLHLRMDWPNAVRGWIANRMLGWISRNMLRSSAQGIAHAAAS
ncbi:Clp protease N-terminal domain-containing protein [Nocardiopsis sp. NPDC101807]|uniref:Clp protease N-terminal domain-containing protein n=1 Tax=Nocardiopsis sp. NPDC101807 TaxID=3364339 RepID=UPI0037FD8F0F